MKQSGLIKIKGSIEGLSFYESKGQHLARKANGFTTERIKNDPALARIRENNVEFGGAAMVSKSLRMGLAQVYNLADGKATNRLFKICRAVIGRGLSNRGQRPFLPLPHKDLLVNFVFDEARPLEAVFRASYSVTTNADRTQASLFVPDFNTSNLMSPPAGATHFRLLCFVSVLSSFTYDPISKAYIVTDPASNGLSAYSTSDYLPLGGNIGSATSVEAVITSAPSLHATSALVVCVGIEFYQTIGTVHYLLGGGTLKIKELF